MPPTDMTQEDRERLAARLILEMETRFRGVAKRAYTEAGVNSTTWSRAVSAQSIKRHTQIEIVANLWPETQGDWTKIPEAGDQSDVGDQMRAVFERRISELERQIAELWQNPGA